MQGQCFSHYERFNEQSKQQKEFHIRKFTLNFASQSFSKQTHIKLHSHSNSGCKNSDFNQKWQIIYQFIYFQQSFIWLEHLTRTSATVISLIFCSVEEWLKWLLRKVWTQPRKHYIQILFVFSGLEVYRLDCGSWKS